MAHKSGKNGLTSFFEIERLLALPGAAQFIVRNMKRAFGYITMKITKKWKDLPEGWKIFIVGIIVTLLFSIWPNIKDLIFSRSPDTYVYLYGLEHSFSIKKLKSLAPIRSKITVHPIKFPKGITDVSNNDVPLKFFNWKYSKNTKLYNIVVHNKGDGIDKNIKIDINFSPSTYIKSINPYNEKRIELIQGGKPTGSRAVFEIEKLLPNERQNIEILVQGNNVKKFTAWSEIKGDILNIYIMDIFIEPDPEYKMNDDAVS